MPALDDGSLVDVWCLCLSKSIYKQKVQILNRVPPDALSVDLKPRYFGKQRHEPQQSSRKSSGVASPSERAHNYASISLSILTHGCAFTSRWMGVNLSGVFTTKHLKALRSFTGVHAIRSMYVELNGPAGKGLAKARESQPFTVFSYSLS